MNLINYLRARSHLKEIKKTIVVMGGEDSCDAFLLAQRDMTSDEVTYFFYQSVSDVIYTLIFLLILIGGYGASDAI